MEPGQVVVLNGTSSAGKTSIARALQGIMDTPYLHTGVDHFLPRLPARFSEVTSEGSDAHSAYFLLVYRDTARREVAEREGGEALYSRGTLVEVRIGEGALRICKGMYSAVAALSRCGVDVVVDDVIYDRRVLQAAVEALQDTPVLFVGLRLPLAEAERRERERGDRGPGGAATFHELVHAHGVYDLEVDTAALSPMECARQIKDALGHATPRQAFLTLCRELGL